MTSNMATPMYGIQRYSYIKQILELIGINLKCQCKKKLDQNGLIIHAIKQNKKNTG